MDYQITIQGSDIGFACEPEQTVLDAAQHAGYEIPYSCRNGICGNCRGRIISGDFESKGFSDVLTHEERADGYTLFCQAQPRSNLKIDVRSIKKNIQGAKKIVKARLFKITKVADDVSVLLLRFPAGIRVPFRPGQYMQVIFEDGRRRSYSMASPGHQTDSVQLHVRHVKGGRFTSYLEDRAAVGDFLDIELPLGDFYLRASDKPLVFVASGTGFAPIKSILESMFKRGFPPCRVYLYWGARRKADLYMLDLPEKWARQYPQFSFIPVLSEESNDVDRKGFVHEAVLSDFDTLSNCDVYACGVPAMINAARRDFVQNRQLPPANFYCDAFVETPP